jgi:hypothetical protein|tara:strand:+ start:146 stop:568 length:423 start_codon:yes stop_codon:yes gene_type:complete
MGLFSALGQFVPTFECKQDQQGFCNLSLVFKDERGLENQHVLSVRYLNNDESKALNLGEPITEEFLKNNPNCSYELGCMIYEDPATGRVHSLSAEKTMAFIKSTEHNAKLVNNIADKAKEAIDAKWQLDQPDQQIGTATA